VATSVGLARPMGHRQVAPSWLPSCAPDSCPDSCHRDRRPCVDLGAPNRSTGGTELAPVLCPRLVPPRSTARRRSRCHDPQRRSRHARATEIDGSASISVLRTDRRARVTVAPRPSTPPTAAGRPPADRAARCPRAAPSATARSAKPGPPASRPAHAPPGSSEHAEPRGRTRPCGAPPRRHPRMGSWSAGGMAPACSGYNRKMRRVDGRSTSRAGTEIAAEPAIAVARSTHAARSGPTRCHLPWMMATHAAARVVRPVRA
jgi:hypothetical protein